MKISSEMNNKPKGKKVCIFTSSSVVADEYMEAMAQLGRTLGGAGCSLVFGGFSNGLMQKVADGFMEARADIIGIVPTRWKKEVHEGCTQVIETKDLAGRKARMIRDSDVFIAAPGGTGTLDELFEVLDLKQTGDLPQPILIYNYRGFFNPLLRWMEQLAEIGFVPAKFSGMIRVCETPEDILQAVREL